MKERNLGIDALRIVSILLVIMLHILGAGGVLGASKAFSATYVMAWFLEALAYCSVNCFGLISGYVGVTARFRISTIVKLWLQAIFCMVVCTVFYWVLYPSRVSSHYWLAIVTPVLNGGYWYYSAYFLLSLCMPLINRALLAAPKREAGFAVGAAFLCLMYSHLCQDESIFQLNDGYSVKWLAMLYMIGGYIRLHGQETRYWIFLKKWGSAAALMLAAAMCGYRILADLPSGVPMKTEKIYHYLSPTVVLCALALLAWFSGWKPGRRTAGAIAFFAPSSFSVYLLHNHDLISWNCIHGRFAGFAAMEPYLLPFAVVGTAAVIYVMCTMIDLVRRHVFRIAWVKRCFRRMDEGLERYFLNE